MSESKNIERIYQEAFNSFEVKPDATVWNTIQADLKQEKKKKRGLLFWFLTASALFFIGFLSYNSINTAKDTAVLLKNNTTKTTHQVLNLDKTKTFLDIIPTNIIFIKADATKKYLAKNTFDFKLNTDFKTNLFQLADYHFVVNSPSFKADAVNDLADNSEEESQKTVALKDVSTKEEQKKFVKEWAIKPYISQTYFNSISRGSPLDVSLINNKKEFETSKTYGFELSRTLSKKWTVNTGLSLLNLNYSTLNIAYRNETIAANRLSGVAYNRFNQYTSVRDIDSNSLLSSSAIAWNEQKGKIRQEIAYIEIPFSVSYALRNSKKMDISVSGGFSSLILTKNELTLHSLDGEQRYFGKANNLSPLNASANVSFGFNYHLGKKLDLSVKPSFRYYLDMFDQNSGSLRPYSVGIATGINIKF